MFKRAILTILLFLLIACNGWAATYYVAQTAQVAAASDDNAGTDPDLPWVTIAKVEATVTNGDTVYFHSASTWSVAAPVLTAAEGVTYDGSTWGSGTQAKLQAASSASALYSVVWIGYSNVTFKGFEVDANDLAIGGIALGGYADHDNDISNITIDNCLIYNVGNCNGVACSNSSTSWSSGIDISPRNGADTAPHSVSNVTIKDTTIHDVVRNGIAVYPVWGDYDGNINDTVLIRNCEIYNAGKNGDQGWWASGVGIHVKDDSRNVTIEFCNLHDNAHSGILYEAYLEDPLVGPTNSIARYNLIYDNEYTGIILQHNETNSSTMSVSLYGNLIWNNGRNTNSKTSSAQLIMSANNWRDSTINIYNNVFSTDVAVVNTTYPRTVVFGTGETNAGAVSGTPTINFKNNILSQTLNTSSAKSLFVDVGQKVTHNNNLYYSGSGETAYRIISGASTYYRTDAEVTGWEATAQTEDPTFTGGDLPSCFSNGVGACGTGTYGTDMVPNKPYFSLQAGSPALNNGAVLASTYSKAINNAGTNSTQVRGTAFDIGAYEATLEDAAAATSTKRSFYGNGGTFFRKTWGM